MIPTYKILLGDAMVTGLPDKSVDLVFGSPPYESQRTYSMGFNLKGQAWVDWMVAGFREWLRVSRGLVAMVVEGYTDDFWYSATPALLMADLHRAGITLRKPMVFHRVGIPGSGGPDFMRNDWEWIICATNGGKLPWSDKTAMGHPPKWAPGGEMSHRLSDGSRRNQWGGVASSSSRKKNGSRQKAHWPSHVISTNGMTMTRARDGTHAQTQPYAPPVKANPGNVVCQHYTAAQLAEMANAVIDTGNVVKCVVGGGVMGHKLSHENEAPFPERLAEFFIRSFCPPGGTVLDPFIGSGTTAAAALKAGRNAIGIDKRFSQVKISTRRCREVAAELAAAAKVGAA